MKAAVLINPSAGGADRIRDVCAAIDSFCAGCEVVASEAFGGGLVRADRLLAADAGARAGYVERLCANVDALASERPDLYLFAGGDGLAAYAAYRLVRTGHVRPKLVGVGMGTANVGPIISFSAGALAESGPERLLFSGCGAVEAFDGAASVAFGFNDVVLGNTLLGTVGGVPMTISARDMARCGKKVPQKPLEDLGDALFVVRNGVRSPSPLPHTAQIVVSSVERENGFGRAVLGMVCFAYQQCEQAVLLLCERPLVVLDYDPRGYETPALSAQLLFGEDDAVRIEGLSPDALIVADGNPYIRKSGPVSFAYRPNVVEIAR